MRIVVDSSVAAKWAIGEVDADSAARLLVDHQIVVPDLLFAEVANILWKAHRRGELSKIEVALGAALIRNSDLDVVESRGLMEAATQLAMELDHPAYDCIYLALASLEAIPLVTADQRLLNKLAQHSLSVRVVALSASTTGL